MFDRDSFQEMDCPVCGEFFFTLSEETDEELGYFTKLISALAIKESVPQCHHCGWKYDLSQIEDEDLTAGENSMSLREYREWYKNKIEKEPDYDYLESGFKAAPHQCPVCEKHTFPDEGSFEICPVCGWQDDPVMNADPDFEGGANNLSLNEYKKRFRES